MQMSGEGVLAAVAAKRSQTRWRRHRVETPTIDEGVVVVARHPPSHRRCCAAVVARAAAEST